MEGKNLRNILDKNAYWIMLGITIILLGIFYWPYFLGNEIYLPSSDLAFERYPTLLHFFDFFSENGWKGWDFSIAGGTGRDYTSYLTNIDSLPLLFGRQHFHDVLIWFHSVKVVLASTFFYLALKQYKINKFACAYGGLFYAFCAIMIVRSNWASYALEMVLVAFLLFALERYFQKKQWWVLLLAIFLIGSQRGVYTLFFYAVAMFFYANARYYIHDGKWKEWFAYIGKCALIMLGALLLLWYEIYPKIISMSSTSRFDTIVETTTSGSIFSIEYLVGSMDRYVAIFNSFFAISLEGVMGGSAYCPNSLDGPLFYCGILTLLLAPQVYSVLKKKWKRIVVLLGIIVVMFFAVPLVTYVFNLGVSKDYFKLNTLWIIMLLLGLAAWALTHILETGYVKIKLLLGTYFVLGIAFSIVNFALPSVRARIDLFMAAKVLIYMTLWTGFFIVWSKRQFVKKVGHVCILLLSASEIFLFARPTTEVFISSAHVLTYYTNIESPHYKQNAALIDEIKEKEGDDNFYRIFFRDYLEYYSYNTENQLYNFRGTGYASAYVNKGYVNFLEAIEVDTDSNPIWRRNAGPKTRYMISSLLGIKYFILPKGEIPAKGLVEINANERHTVYENEYVLPLGVGFEKVISQEEFENLSVRQKGLALLNAVVTDDENLLKHQHYVSDLPVEYKKLDVLRLQFENIKGLHVEGESDVTLEMEKGGRINVPIYESPWSEENEYIFSFEIWAGRSGTISVQWLKDGQWYNKKVDYSGSGDKIHVTIDDASSEWLVIDLLTYNKEITIRNMRYEYSNSAEIDRLYQEAIEARRGCAVEYSMYSDSHMKGTVEAKEDLILFYAMSYEEGWKVMVDGEEVECEIVDYGFIGIPVKKGIHEIELLYE